MFCKALKGRNAAYFNVRIWGLPTWIDTSNYQIMIYFIFNYKLLFDLWTQIKRNAFYFYNHTIRKKLQRLLLEALFFFLFSRRLSKISFLIDRCLSSFFNLFMTSLLSPPLLLIFGCKRAIFVFIMIIVQYI